MQSCACHRSRCRPGGRTHTPELKTAPPPGWTPPGQMTLIGPRLIRWRPPPPQLPPPVWTLICPNHVIESTPDSCVESGELVESFVVLSSSVWAEPTTPIPEHCSAASSLTNSLFGICGIWCRLLRILQQAVCCCVTIEPMCVVRRKNHPPIGSITQALCVFYRAGVFGECEKGQMASLPNIFACQLFHFIFDIWNTRRPYSGLGDCVYEGYSLATVRMRGSIRTFSSCSVNVARNVKL